MACLLPADCLLIAASGVLPVPAGPFDAKVLVAPEVG
jgi:hypothetical protein